MNIRLPLALSALVLLAACGKSTPPAAPAATASAPPLTAELQKLYDGSCKTCHSVPETGAPQAGDTKAWAPRVAQGKDALINHVIGGYQKMPPMGLCMQCTEEEFVALTEHMAGAKLQ